MFNACVPYIIIKGEYLDVNKCIKEVGCNAPFLVVFIEDKDKVDTKLVVESVNIFDMPSLKIGVQCCFASYFIYNIAYTPIVAPFLIFLEHVFDMKFTQKPPISLSYHHNQQLRQTVYFGCIQYTHNNILLAIIICIHV